MSKKISYPDMTNQLNPEEPFDDVVAVLWCKQDIVPGDEITVDLNHSGPRGDNVKIFNCSCDAGKKCRSNNLTSPSYIPRHKRLLCDHSFQTARDRYEDILIQHVHRGQIQCPYANCNRHFFHSSNYYDHLAKCHHGVDPIMPSGKPFLHDYPCEHCGHQSKGPLGWARHDLICKSTLQCDCTQPLEQGSDSSESTSDSEDDDGYVQVDFLCNCDKNGNDCADKQQLKSRKVLCVNWNDFVEDHLDESEEKVQT